MKGNTLIEVILGVLIVGIVAVSALGVAVSSRAGSGRQVRRAAAALAGQRLLDTLKSYVTSDQAALPGPGVGFNGWALPGDSCDCYALSGGTHTLDSSRWLSALAAYGGTISYTVSTASTANGAQPTVALNIAWNEP